VALSMPVGTDATTFPTYTFKINDVSNQTSYHALC
jgi:hypothetical protein